MHATSIVLWVGPTPGDLQCQGPRRPLHEWPTVKSASGCTIYNESRTFYWTHYLPVPVECDARYVDWWPGGGFGLDNCFLYSDCWCSFYLVTHRDGSPAFRQSPIQVLTGRAFSNFR